MDYLLVFGLMSLGIGAFFCFFLLFSSTFNISNISLVFLLLVLLINLAYALCIHTGFIQKLPVLYFLFNKGYLLHLLVYPLFIIFIQSYSRKKPLWIFIGFLLIPPLLVLINSIYQFLLAEPGFAQQRVIQFLQDTRPGPENVFQSTFLFAATILIPTIVLTSAAFELYNYFAKGVLKKTKFLLAASGVLMLAIFFFRLLSFPIQELLYAKTGVSFIEWDLEVIYTSVCIIALSFLVMVQDNLNKLGNVQVKGSTYSASSLTYERMQILIEEIQDLVINRKYYQVQGFSISDLSEELDVNEKYLSQAINQTMGVTFTEFINRCRIERAKQMLHERKYDHYSVEAIAEEAGFTARSTFYRVFKNEVGMSPAEFKKINR